MARSRRTPTAHFAVAAGIVLALWFLTLIASGAPWFVVTVFWLIVGSAITFWVLRDAHNDLSRSKAILDSALRRNEADLYHVRAARFAELEEIQDEGACYAFEIDADRIVFIAGQEFYAGAKFPSLDFSLVYVLDERGETVEMFIDKRGAKTAPAMKIPAAKKRELEIPDHLVTRVGRIDDLEVMLGRS